MTPQTIVVPELFVHVVTGETCHPSEGGFSSISAEVPSKDKNLDDKLSEIQKDKETVTLRCAMLDATGKITNSTLKDREKLFILSVTDIVFRKP